MLTDLVSLRNGVVTEQANHYIHEKDRTEASTKKAFNKKLKAFSL